MKDKYRKVFSEIFRKAPDQEEIERVSEKANLQKLKDQNLNYQNQQDQILNHLERAINVLIDSDLTPTEKFALATFMIKSRSSVFKISINKVAEALRISRTTAATMMGKLRRLGAVVKQDRTGTTVDIMKIKKG